MAVDPAGSEEDAALAPTVVRAPLLRLQDLDLSIDRLHARLRDIESGDELDQARRRLAEAEARLAERKLSSDELDREQRRLENDIDSMQRKIAGEERRLTDGTVANPRELQSIQAEVDNLRSRRSRLEDELIDRMERREELETHIGPAESDVAQAKARVADIEETSGRDIVEIEAALRERTSEREAASAELDPELLVLYEDLRRQKKGVGAAALIDGVCQACHQKLSAVYLNKLRTSTGIRRCEYCRRILVLA